MTKTDRMTTRDIMRKAAAVKTVVPAFNIPHLPMMAPIVQALRDLDTFGLIQVARLEWEKFQSRSLRAVRDEYERVKDERHTRLHLDHVPVIDEDGKRVDYALIIAEALALGYESVMVDGSRLSLDENIAATRKAVALAHAAGRPAEAELGAVMGHEAGPLPPYEELFRSGRGFTDPAEAVRFVNETGLDWLSVAIGNIHGAVAAATRGQKKIQARLDIAHLQRIREQTGVPLVLHGGSGIFKECILEAVRHGIAKINVATTLRQAYEGEAEHSIDKAQKAVYAATLAVVKDELEIVGSARLLALS